MQTIRVHRLTVVMVVALVLGGMLACDFGAAPKPSVTVTSPPSGTEVQVGEEVDIESTVTDPKGIVRVELAVDGVLYRTDASPSPEGVASWSLVQTWTATDPGVHTLTVTAYNADDVASVPWAIAIEVLEGPGVERTATPTSTTEAPPPATATPPPPPPPTGTAEPPPPPTPTEPGVPSEPPEITYFRADGTDGSITVDPGTTVTLGWEWERVEEGYLDPGNIPLACPTMPCTYDVSPAATTTYTLRAVNSVGTDEATVAVVIEEAPVLPDLYIAGLVVNPQDPGWGDPVQASVDVGNMGNAASGPYQVLWRYGDGDFDVCEWNMTSLPAGDGGTLHCDVDHMYEPYTTVATVDPFDEVEESNEDNNSMEFSVDVEAAALPDLQIVELNVTPPNPAWGDPIHAQVGILNGGTVASGPYKVLWRYGDGDFDVCEWNQPALPAGDGGYLNCDVDHFYESYTTVATVDPFDEVEESNELNNSMESTVNVG
jgi:hypothetical protein